MAAAGNRGGFFFETPMAENKTKPTNVSPAAFIKRVTTPQQGKDSNELIAMMRKITGEPPKMWGPSIIGFGTTTYALASGKTGEICTMGFSPRKPSLVLYIGAPLKDKTLMSKLGKYTAAGGCLHIKKLDDVNRDVLRKLIEKAVKGRSSR